MCHKFIVAMDFPSSFHLSAIMEVVCIGSIFLTQQGAHTEQYPGVNWMLCFCRCRCWPPRGQGWMELALGLKITDLSRVPHPVV